MFNGAKSAEKGFALLEASGFLGEGTADDKAAFLLDNDGKLELAKVGDYVGGGDDEHKEVLRIILQTFDFEGVPLDSALRMFIALIKLPGESQKIDRIISRFSERFVACNPHGEHALDHEDTGTIIAFSLVMLNVDAHSDKIAQKRKMTVEQYLNNLRGICTDGSSPNASMLRGLYARVTRYEWAVEERARMTVVREGWLSKASSRKVGGADRPFFAVLSTRALYFYRSDRAVEPAAYLRLEGLGVRGAMGKGAWRFELYAIGADGSKIDPNSKEAKESSDGRMVKLAEPAEAGGAPRKTISRHSSFLFTCESHKEAREWVEAVRCYTLDDPQVAATPSSPTK